MFPIAPRVMERVDELRNALQPAQHPMKCLSALLFWSGLFALVGLSAWVIVEWLSLIQKFSVPVDYFVPITEIRWRAGIVSNLIAALLPLVVIAFLRRRRRLSMVPRWFAVIGQGMAVAVVLLYVSRPEFRNW
jgi:hypothetical protein